jgi:tRNA A-37 threonylcarbamoyl transferase component Bud32
VVPSKARSEWKALLRFEQSRLPCPRAQAFMEKRALGLLRESCLITESLAPAVELNDCAAAPAASLAEKRDIIVLLADMVRALHGHNIFYRDLHAGNILMRRSESGAPRLFFIDLHRAVFLPRIFGWMRTRDLAQLCNSLGGTMAQRLLFLQRYSGADSCRDKPCQGLRRAVGHKAAALERRRILSRSKRCVKNSSVFECDRSFKERYCGRKDFGRDAARAALAAHKSRLSKKDSIKSSSKSALTCHGEHESGPLCVKEYRYLGAAYMIKNLFRRSRAMKSWRAAHGLIVRGISTPLPLALVERRLGPLVVESFLVTMWLPDAPALNDYVRSRVSGFSPGKRKSFIRSLSRSLGKLHRQGIYHADLKSNNILVEERGRGGGWTFSFIDLDRVRFARQVTDYQRINNLAQINASVASVMTVRERLLFFRLYASEEPFFAERKHWYRLIMHIGRHKITEPYGVRFH